MLENLSAHEFDQISRLAKEKFGLDLRKGKEALVCARLSKKMREGQCGSFKEYYRYLLDDSTGAALTGMIDALATNHTSFLREPQHFEFLRKALGARLAAQAQTEIWSAACSTGEEPYTVALCLLDEMARLGVSSNFPPFRILATDISTRALATARQGVYAAERFQSFPADWLKRFFLRGSQAYEGWYRLKPEVTRLVEFSRLNLIEPLPFSRCFQVVFCRNVMIYFDKATQTGVVNRLAERIEPGGYLLVGHAESLNGIDHRLEYIQPAVYRRPGGESRRGKSAR